MAKSVKIKNYNIVPVPAFAMESSTFFNLLKDSLDEDKSISIILGRPDQNHTILENMTDVELHKPLLKGDLIIYTNKFEMRISGRKSVIISDELSPAVNALVERLSAFTPLHRKFFQFADGNLEFKGLIVGLLSAPYFLAGSILLPEILISYIAQILVLTGLLSAMFSIFHHFGTPVIFFRAQESFLSRNRDKIVWSAISVVATIVSALFVAKYGQKLAEILLSKLP